MPNSGCGAMVARDPSKVDTTGSIPATRTMKKSKAKNQRAHAKRRLRERHGILAHNDTRKVLIKAVQDQEAKLIERQSNRVTVWEHVVGGELFRFVYDKKRKEIVTFLPKAS